MTDRTFLIRVKEDTYVKMMEIQKYLRFHETQDRKRKTMDYVVRYLIDNYEEREKGH